MTLLGVVVTWYFNMLFISAGKPALDFISDGFCTAASSSLTMDILVASTVFFVWMYIESRRLRMRYWWIYILITYGVAFACAFPLFLLMRERALAGQQQLPCGS